VDDKLLWYLAGSAEPSVLERENFADSWAGLLGHPHVRHYYPTGPVQQPLVEIVVGDGDELTPGEVSDLQCFCTLCGSLVHDMHKLQG
jgi:hypothetical protein